MKLGTATITYQSKWYFVTWMNHGNFLKNEPRPFRTRQDAEDFCRERGLRVVSS